MPLKRRPGERVNTRGISPKEMTIMAGRGILGGILGGEIPKRIIKNNIRNKLFLRIYSAGLRRLLDI